MPNNFLSPIHAPTDHPDEPEANGGIVFDNKIATIFVAVAAVEPFNRFNFLMWCKSTQHYRTLVLFPSICLTRTRGLPNSITR